MTRTNLLLLTLMGVLFFSSCKKEDEPPSQNIDPADAVALSKNIKVWHGQRIQGMAPTSGTGGPSIIPISEPVMAVAGRYAIIKPEVASGVPSGYYVQVNGAQEHFKIDYTKPLNMERRMQAKNLHNRALSRGMKIDSTGNGTLDSAIVITIPSTIQPGQFCFTYFAYDSLGYTGNPVTVCVNVLSFAGDTSFHGKWHITGVSYDTTFGWEPLYGVTDTMFSQGYCVNNMVVDTFGSGPGFFDYPLYMYSNDKADLTFGTNGGMKYEYGDTYKEFNFMASTCNNYVFYTDSYVDVLTGAWSFNAATNKMIIIFEFDDYGVPEAEAWEYAVTKIHPGKFYLYDSFDDAWLRFEK